VAANGASKAGRRPAVSTANMLLEAARIVASVGVAKFSVRELAKALDLVPGTIHARFGNRDELLGLLYLQRIALTGDALEALTPADLTDAASFLSAMSGHLAALRHDYVLHFENLGNTRARLQDDTWDALKLAFRALIERCYERFAEAAANEGVSLTGGTHARRLLWTQASTMDSVRAALTFEHTDAHYRRFVARSLLSALTDPATKAVPAASEAG
jgi:AcrR family transcriptional regulator